MNKSGVGCLRADSCPIARAFSERLAESLAASGTACAQRATGGGNRPFRYIIHSLTNVGYKINLEREQHE